MAKEHQRVTSADVARVSGLSRATVSYVLNNNPRQSIPPETRERVLKAARELGYHPYTPARILRAGYSQLVLVVIQFEQVDPSIAHSLKELEARLAARGFSLIWYVGIHLMPSHTHPSVNLTPGVIVSFVNESDPTITAFLQQFNVPILPLHNPASRPSVGNTQVGYLFEHHQRRIVFAAPERADLQRLANAHLEGVRQACAQYKLEPPLVQVVPASRREAHAAMTALLAQQSPPFGICCYNDEVAFAVIAALSDSDIPIPASVAVIGCDDIPLAQFCHPPLTTIRFDNQRVLDLLTENILAANQGKPVQEPPPISLAVVVRQSA